MSPFEMDVFENAPVGMQVLDADSLTVQWANRACLRFLDEPFASQGITGLHLRDYLPKADESGLVRIYLDVARTGIRYTSDEFAYDGFSRGTTYWSWTLHRIDDPTGTHGPRLLTISSEVTPQALERKTQERRFARLSETYRFVSRVLDCVDLPISYIDDTLVYRLCNDAAAKALGSKSELIVGKPLAEIVGENTHIYDAVKTVIETGVPFTSMVHFRGPDGTIRNYEVSYSADRTEGKVVGAVTAAIDVTELIAAQIELQRASRRQDS